MSKIMVPITLLCYFVALMFGLMWYLTYQQLAAERMLSMTRLEAEGYLTIPPPSGAEIKRLVQQRTSLEASVNLLESQLIAKREEQAALTQSLAKLQKQLNELVVRKSANEQGARLARTLSGMRPEEAASALAALDPSVLPDVVEYALPYIQETSFNKLMGAISKLKDPGTPPLAAQILEIIGTSLFSMNSQFQPQLDTGTLTPELRQQFAQNGILLSEQAAVVVDKQGDRWIVTDRNRIYRIRRERGTLNVYVRKATQT